MNTKFKAVGGLYIITNRGFEDRTFPSKAGHRPLAIGQTADLASALVTKSEFAKLVTQGANCVCVCAIADEARRVEIEKDLVEGNEQWGGRLHYLFQPHVSEKAPGVSSDP